MKLYSVGKDIWSNDNDKTLFPVATNSGTYGIFDYSLADAGKEYIIGKRRHGT